MDINPHAMARPMKKALHPAVHQSGLEARVFKTPVDL